MIKNFSESDVYNILMTSDFQDGWNNSDLIELLIKFRYYYRLSLAKTEQTKKELDDLKLKSDNEMNILKRDLYKALEDNKEFKNKISVYKNKKLTFLERVTGKFTDDE